MFKKWNRLSILGDWIERPAPDLPFPAREKLPRRARLAKRILATNSSLIPQYVAALVLASTMVKTTWKVSLPDLLKGCLAVRI